MKKLHEAKLGSLRCSLPSLCCIGIIFSSLILRELQEAKATHNEARSFSSPRAAGVPGTHGCCRRPSGDLGLAEGWPCWGAAGAGRPQFISGDDRVGLLHPRGLSDLGKLPLPPAGCLLAVLFPSKPFTQHPRNIIGHHNLLGLTFQQVRAT